MLDSIGFENYRIFDKETIINLKPITILTGPNSSGKSSVIKAMKLMKQNTQLLNFGFPLDLSFIPDNFGHFLGEMSSIVNRNALSIENNNISFLYQLFLPALGDECFGKITYRINTEIETKGEFYMFSIIVKKSGKTQTLISLFADGKIFINQMCHKIFVNYKAILEVYLETFLPLLKRVEIEINKSQSSTSENKLKHIIQNLPHFGGQFDQIEQRNKNIYPLNSYFYESIKPEKWRNFNKRYPLLPYYKIVIGEIGPDAIDQKLCENVENDYNKINYEFAKLHEREVLRASEALGFNSKGPLNKLQLDSIRSYFKNYDQEVFSFINKNNISFAFIHEPISEKLMIEWNMITALNPFHAEDLEHISAQLAGFKGLENFVTMFDYLYYFSEKEDYENLVIIKNFIETIILDSERQIVDLIKAPYFFDSNRIEQTLFYHSSNSFYGYNILNDFYKPGSQVLNNDYDKRTKFVKEQLAELGIADNFRIIPSEFGIYSICLVKGDIETPLSESGYGITKIFFLLLAISLYDILYIEEPETNLHPDLQSKLADLFVNVQKLKEKQLIIETHSEYFIRKLQYLVAKNEVDKDQVLINYFNPASLREKEGIIREIRILKDGSLSTDFGPGFFDEALNWKFELLKLKNLN